MRQPFRLRVCLLATFIVPVMLVLGAGLESSSLAQGMRIEKYWKCSRCGGYLGNGVAPPPSCHHCEAKRKAAEKASKASNDTPLSTFLVAGVVLAAVGGMAFLLLNSRPTTGDTPPR